MSGGNGRFKCQIEMSGGSARLKCQVGMSDSNVKLKCHIQVRHGFKLWVGMARDKYSVVMLPENQFRTSLGYILEFSCTIPIFFLSKSHAHFQTVLAFRMQFLDIAWTSRGISMDISWGFPGNFQDTSRTFREVFGQIMGMF